MFLHLLLPRLVQEHRLHLHLVLVRLLLVVLHRHQLQFLELLHHHLLHPLLPQLPLLPQNPTK